MQRNFFEEIKILEALRAYLDQAIVDLSEIATEEQKRQLLKTKLIFDDGESCYTAGSTIVIGSEFPYFSKDNMNLCYRQVQAAILHELAHNFLTNFKVYQRFVITAPQKYGINTTMAKTVINILEDYRIERRMQEIIPFGKKLFLILRSSLVNNIYMNAFKTKIETYQQEIQYILNSMLYAGFTETLVHTHNASLNQMLEQIRNIVMEAKYSYNTEQVAECADKIMRILISEYKNEMVVGEDIKALLGKMSEKGTRFPNETDIILSEAAPSPIDKEGKPKNTFANSTPPFVADITANLNEGEGEEYSEKAYNRMLEDINNEDITAQIINEYLYYDEPTNDETIKFSEIEQISKIAKENINTKKLKLIVEDNIAVRYSENQYQQIKDPLQNEIDETISALSELKEDSENDFEEGLKYGELNMADIYKFAAYNESDVFKLSTNEQDTFDMDVMLLIDESGSNSSLVYNPKNKVSLERYKLNRMIAVFLHEILKGMQWKHTVWTFHTQSQNEVITPLLSFEESLDARGLNFGNIYARGSNRDGYHIRVAGEYLSKNSEADKKLLIVLSDGQPSAPHYGGELGMADVKRAVEETTERGVVVVGVFSGSSEENKFFECTEEKPKGMYQKAIFINNEKIFEFKKVFKDLLIEFYEE